MAKSDRFYFENYAAAADCCSKAAAYLQECLTHYDYANIQTMLEKMHTIEHEADGVKHEMTAALAKAFVTPMEREDMAQISANIDEVADFIEEVIQRMYVNRIEAVMRRSLKRKNKERATYPLGSFLFDVQKQTLTRGEAVIKLTTKECELLTLLCVNFGEILQRDYALKTIWVDDNYFNARSMDVYITKLRKHLKDDPSVEIINVHGKGYKLIAPEFE